MAREHKEELHKYITGLGQNRGAKMLTVHCVPDHTHLFVGYKPTISISDFLKEIKVESNEFLNGKNWVIGKFGWQEGYGVFSRNSYRNFKYHSKNDACLIFLTSVL